MKLRDCFSSLSIATFVLSSLTATACSGDSQPSSPVDTSVGGAASTGGQSSGTAATGGMSTTSTGGTVSSTGGAATSSTKPESTGGQTNAGGQGNVGGTKANFTTGAGGTKAEGGTAGVGGKVTGGVAATGGKGTGGANAGATGLGGASATGGTKAAGGTAGAGGKGVGGASTEGGTKAVGGATGVGGTKATGGTTTAGGTNAVGGNSSTATSGYCPETGPCKISPLGDSITEGMGWTPPGASTWGGGYRVKLFSQANAAGKNITFVGTRSNGPTTVDGKTFPKNHEGTSGITIEDLMNNVVGKGALTGSAVNPHIILLHIGTNNMYGTHSQPPETYMAQILDKIIAACPNALLVVAKIIPYPGNTSGISSLNSKIPALVEERAAKGAHIIMVDQFTGFDTGTQLSDGVHPNESGYTRMANVWYTAISQYLH